MGCEYPPTKAIVNRAFLVYNLRTMRTTILIWLAFSVGLKASTITVSPLQRMTYAAKVPSWATPQSGLYDKLTNTVELDVLAAPQMSLLSLIDLAGNPIEMFPMYSAGSKNQVFAAALTPVPGSQYMLTVANNTPNPVEMDLNGDLFGYSVTAQITNTPEPRLFWASLIALLSMMLHRRGKVYTGAQ